MKKILVLLAALVVVASEAEAGNCQWRVNPTNVAFGVYSVFGTGSLTATSSYTIRCTPHTTGVVSFTAGANATTYFPRYMANGSSLLGYNLYKDAANSVVIGDGSGGTTAINLVNATPQQKDFVETFYAATPLGSDRPPGVYTDTVTAVLSWDNFASSSSVTFTVTTTIQPECTVATVPVAFGNYDPVVAHAASPLDGAGTVNVYCTAGTSATVSLGNGLNFAGGVRRMFRAPASFLDYQLYRDPGRSGIWSTTPNTVSGTSSSRLTPIGGGLVVYGRIPAGQDVIAGLHSDTVQATVNY